MAALEHNIKAIKSKIAGGAKFCAVVKADAYGHGAVKVAKRALSLGADYLAVAVLSEAIELREANITAPILILGATTIEEAEAVVRYDVTQAVFTIEAASALSKAAIVQNKVAKVHLVTDTGMGRIGVRPEDAGKLAKKIAELKNIELEGMFSHFAAADESDKSFAREQLKRFKTALDAVEGEGVKLKIRHLANSAAILELPETHFDMVRAGIILYGLWPSSEVERVIELKPLMSVKARVTFVKTLYAGETVSYGCTYTAEKDTRIATLPLGYADGWSRLYAGKASVLFAGKLLPVVGRICMDQCMIDASSAPELKIGDTVTIFGAEKITADTLAAHLGTINYEVVCMMSPRLPRVFSD